MNILNSPAPVDPMVYVGLTLAGQREVMDAPKSASESYYRSLVAELCHKVGVDPSLVLSRTIQGNYAEWRYALCIYLQAQYGLPNSAAARVLGRTHSTMILGTNTFLAALSIGDKIATDVAERLYAATGYKITGKPKNPKTTHKP